MSTTNTSTNTSLSMTTVAGNNTYKQTINKLKQAVTDDDIDSFANAVAAAHEGGALSALSKTVNVKTVTQFTV